MQEEHTPPLARPRYLGHWLLCGLLWLIVQLPQPLRMTLGGWLGRLFFRLTPLSSRHQRRQPHHRLPRA